MIPFNKPYLTGKETKYIEEAVASGKISGNGIFTRQLECLIKKMRNLLMRNKSNKNILIRLLEIKA